MGGKNLYFSEIGDPGDRLPRFLKFFGSEGGALLRLGYVGDLFDLVTGV